MKLYEVVNTWLKSKVPDKVPELYGQINEIKEFTKNDIEEIKKYFPCYERFLGKTLDELKKMNKENSFSEDEHIASVLFVEIDTLIGFMQNHKVKALTWEENGKQLQILIAELLARLLYKLMGDESKVKVVREIKERMQSIYEEREDKKVGEVEKAGAKKSNIDAMKSITKGKFKTTDDEVITMLELEDLLNLQSFVHPYAKSLDKNDEAIKALSEDIKKNGVISPIIVRKLKGNSYYEILSGHRRTKAARLAGLDEIPAIVKEDITDEEAICIITDNENQRKDILPSERAKAYKLRKEILDASMKLAKNESAENAEISIKNEGENFGYTECTEESESGKRWRDTEEGKQMLASLGVEHMTFYNYMKLNDLTDELLNMVDDKVISIKVAVQLSKLDKSIQEFMVSYLQTEKLSEKEANILAKEQQTLIGYKNAGTLDILSVKNLIKDNLELEEAEKEKPKKAKINMTKIFGEIRKKCNGFKGDDKKRFEKISEERFREITTEAVMKAIEKELAEIAELEIRERYKTDEL